MAISQITFEFDELLLKRKAGIKNVAARSMLQIYSSKNRGRKSLKEMGMNADLVEIPEDEILFQKQYYSIGDVATMFKENTSLIRYWENEFSILKPKKNKKGDRFFRPEDVKNLK